MAVPAALAVWLMVPSSALGQADDVTLEQMNVYPLKGLRGVQVLVEELSDDAQEAGLMRKQIQTDVELRLRMAGIPVLTSDEAVSTSGAAVLIVNVSFITTSDQRSAYYIDLSLLQQMYFMDYGELLEAHVATSILVSLRQSMAKVPETVLSDELMKKRNLILKDIDEQTRKRDEITAKFLQLDGRHKLPRLCATRHAGLLATVPAIDAVRDVRDDLKDLVEDFCNDFLNANNRNPSMGAMTPGGVPGPSTQPVKLPEKMKEVPSPGE